MVRFFRLTTGAKIEFDDAKKKDMLIVEEGHAMNNLFKHVGKVDANNTYQQAVIKIRAALQTRGNHTSAAFNLFNGHSQSFHMWHQAVYKAAKLIDWTD